MAYELPTAKWQDNVNQFAHKGYVLLEEVPASYDSGFLVFPIEHADQVIAMIQAVVAQAKVSSLVYAGD